MKAARLIVLGVALAAGRAAAMLASGLRQPEAPKAVPPPPPLATVDVLVVKTDLNTGQVVGAGDVGWQTWPAASANAIFIKKSDRPEAIKEFVGAIVRSSIAAGEPIRDPKVVAANCSGSMAAILPHGMRAISLDIAPDTGAGGFILPNDHVDVLLTGHDKAAEKAGGVEKFISETILRNVRVLAVDQAVEEKDGKKVVIGKVGTGNERAAAAAGREVRSILAASGVPADGIVVRGYHPPGGRLATIHITYPKISAQAGPCGLWPQDIGPSLNRGYFENQPPWNFGCANQRNLAAMVDNPADLVQPRGETPAYTMRRTTVLDNYRQGKPTGTNYPSTDVPKIATVSSGGQ